MFLIGRWIFLELMIDQIAVVVADIPIDLRLASNGSILKFFRDGFV